MFLVPWIQNEISKNMFFVPEMRSQVRNVTHYRMHNTPHRTPEIDNVSKGRTIFQVELL